MNHTTIRATAPETIPIEPDHFAAAYDRFLLEVKMATRLAAIRSEDRRRQVLMRSWQPIETTGEEVSP
jgi:hypothetical protein